MAGYLVFDHIVWTIRRGDRSYVTVRLQAMILLVGYARLFVDFRCKNTLATKARESQMKATNACKEVYKREIRQFTACHNSARFGQC